MIVKFSTLAGGVFIEITGADDYSDTDRCFRFNKNGTVEYALYGDLTSDKSNPCWNKYDHTGVNFLFA